MMQIGINHLLYLIFKEACFLSKYQQNTVQAITFLLEDTLQVFAGGPLWILNH